MLIQQVGTSKHYISYLQNQNHQKKEFWLISEVEQEEEAIPVQSDVVPALTPPPVATAHLGHSKGEEDNQSLSVIFTPNGYGCD